MMRDNVFGFDPTVNRVFVFLFEHNSKVLSLFIEYVDEKTKSLAKDELALFAIFWDTGATPEALINMFNASDKLKKINARKWVEKG